MKKYILISMLGILFFGACDILSEISIPGIPLDGEKSNGRNTWKVFNQKSPISTSFDDAVYEVASLTNFEPDNQDYLPLDIQPKSDDGGYILKSGLYSMNAQSFCLRGYTHGPSRGDGHLYAPLEGEKKILVQAILQKYGEKSEIPQKNVQVLLWAIIAGADMETLGDQHSKTLNQLFSVQEILELQGKDLLSGVVNDQLDGVKSMFLNNVSPKVREFLEADNKIRTMVQQNKSFSEIERIAIIAGAAPREDMIREVSKGRWSYHPDGYFIRFFPSGYPQTRVDIYVPFKGESVHEIEADFNYQNDTDYRLVKEVNYNPAKQVAVPANQASQRIGLSARPVNPFPHYRFPETGCKPNNTFDSGSPRYSKKVDKIEIRGSERFINMVMKALSVLKKDAPEFYKYYISNNKSGQKNILKGIGLDCHYGKHTIDAYLYARLVVENEERFKRFSENPEIAAAIIIHEAVHVHQANAYMQTVGYGNFENFLNYYNRNKKSFEDAASDRQIDYLEIVLNKFKNNQVNKRLIEAEIRSIKA